LIQVLIDAGLEKAADIVLVDPDRDPVDPGVFGDFETAKLATDLNIYAPVVFVPPRVLVTLSEGGVADWVADPGVAVERFDWQDLAEETAQVGAERAAQKLAVPPGFADLAEPLDIPVAPSFRLTVTEGDPRLDSVGETVFDKSDWDREGAEDAAKLWSSSRYFASVYASDGEAVFEAKPGEYKMSGMRRHLKLQP
jgi:hypothetical protein